MAKVDNRVSNASSLIWVANRRRNIQLTAGPITTAIMSLGIVVGRRQRNRQITGAPGRVGPMRFDPSFLDEIRDRLPIEEVIGRVVKLKRIGKEFKGISPFNAEKSPSFYAIPAKRMFHCFSSGHSGDVFRFLMLTEGLRFPDAVEACARMAGVPMPRGWRSGPSTPDPATEAEEAARRARVGECRAAREAVERDRARFMGDIAREVWSEAKSIAGTPAERYLESRGILFPGPFKALRFHPECPYKVEGGLRRFPALIAAAQRPDDDRLQVVWRILLTPDGYKLTSVAAEKAGLGSFEQSGAAVRLGPLGPVAHVCEGIETGLGIFGLLGQSQGVCAALSTSGMVNFKPPPGTERVLIWPDGDRNRVRIDERTGLERFIESPGHRAAQILEERLSEAGMPVSIQFIPKDGRDFLDVWRSVKDHI